LALIVALVVNPANGLTSQMFDDAVDPGWSAFTLVYAPVTVGVIGFLLWQLITQRPVLTVDQDGIRLGTRKRRLRWSEIGTVGFVSGTKGLQSLPVIPNDAWAKGFDIRQDNVKDLAAFAGWLAELIDQRRTEVRG
jgi:hypothetical protein